MKKTWIKVRRGLLEKKHRERLGARIWLYIYMLDTADWETGTIPGWTDATAARELDMPHRTVQDQRQRLESDGYITSVQGFQCLNLTIINWINPREYSGKVYNTAEHGTESSVPYGTESSVPIQSESSVPLQYSPHINTLKDSQLKEGRKRPSRKRDPRLDHPAVIAYREEAHLTAPHAVRDDLCKVEDVERWRQVVKNWIGKGYRPQNITGMLDVYRNGFRMNGAKPDDRKAKMDAVFAELEAQGYE